MLGERYQVQELVGRGALATVYRGRDVRLDREVAIKVLRDIFRSNPEIVMSFQAEARAASTLQHPNIVQVYDDGQTDGTYFMVMEFVEGTDLRRYLRSNVRLEIKQAVRIAHDVALGLGEGHRHGMVHRHIIPQSVLIGSDGRVKLTHFGRTTMMQGIPYYLPEQTQGEMVGPAADVYGLGILMYDMLTGCMPFDGETPVAVAMQHIHVPPVPPSQWNPTLPPEVERIILRCLEKEPDRRFRDGEALACALAPVAESRV